MSGRQDEVLEDCRVLCGRGDRDGHRGVIGLAGLQAVGPERHVQPVVPCGVGDHLAHGDPVLHRLDGGTGERQPVVAVGHDALDER